MIVDTSAVIAILRREPEEQQFRRALTEASAKMGAPTRLETAIVIDGLRDPVVSAYLDTFLEQHEIATVAFTAEHAAIARRAYRDFGKGSGHPARLNFGDCMTYAVAAQANDALLYKGTDFAQTGIRSATTNV